MSLATQAKVLNAIEEKEICPVGSHVPVKVDFRLIGATNTDIQKLVKEKRMRQDLYYRLGEYIVTLPPLRERPDDIQYFAGKFMGDHGNAGGVLDSRGGGSPGPFPWPCPFGTN